MLQFLDHCNTARRMFEYPYFDVSYSSKVRFWSKERDGSDGPASADVCMPSVRLVSEGDSGSPATSSSSSLVVHDPLKEVREATTVRA